MPRKRPHPDSFTPRYYELQRLSQLAAADESAAVKAGGSFTRPLTRSERAFRKLSEAVLRTPAPGLLGAFEIAVVAEHWADKWEDGELQGLDPNQPIASRSLTILLHAIRTLARGLEKQIPSLQELAATAA